MPASLAAAEPFSTQPLASEQSDSDFQLGGATRRAALSQELDFADPVIQRQRLSLPAYRPNSVNTDQEASVGGATLFFGDRLESGRDTVQMGTFVQRGQTRAGVSITFLETEETVSRSELFLDYSLTENFSVGLSGILNTELSDAETVPQLGLSAAFSTDDGGAYLQGGVADAVDYDPVIGLSIGLRF